MIGKFYNTTMYLHFTKFRKELGRGEENKIKKETKLQKIGTPKTRVL